MNRILTSIVMTPWYVFQIHVVLNTKIMSKNINNKYSIENGHIKTRSGKTERSQYILFGFSIDKPGFLYYNLYQHNFIDDNQKIFTNRTHALDLS